MLRACARGWGIVMVMPACNAFAAQACGCSADKRTRGVHGSLTRPMLAGRAQAHAWGIAGHSLSLLM
jgi:hypothetical protein